MLESPEVVKSFDKRFDLILGDKFRIREKETETGLIEFDMFMLGGKKRSNRLKHTCSQKD